MTSNTALIVHAIFDAPSSFKEMGGVISNGYYKVAMDGAVYGSGSAIYQASSADQEVLCKAIDEWKDETGWQPKEAAPEVAEAPTFKIEATNDMNAYKEFSRSIRSNLKSFTVHKDSAIFASGVQNCIDTLDAVLRPMSKIEGK